MNHEHVFIQGEDEKAPVLLLLHGTGGNERDLLPIAQMIDPTASVLGVRGNVLENGMPRFFRRIAEGVFDEEDLIKRTKELHTFLDEMALKYTFTRDQVYAVGYSNGANIAASLLYLHENSLRGAILFHAMVPLRGVNLPDLSGAPVFIGAGKHDPLIPMEETKELVKGLQDAKSPVTEYWTEGGHQLTREEIEQARNWFEEVKQS
ncbi:alpha/beta hydrolase [Bacillus horti]|uniref:Phospholipase/carboxylesterase n=1 Tax=Caldalkalibacillus horti TaxID=77523 RepID=A0ABT9W354_9BACI|nr:alpha/beta hydrolase [Bacillus horti]MDQ0167667.1 phospholipase/carboxylesterase [Bacillus horti]